MAGFGSVEELEVEDGVLSDGVDADGLSSFSTNTIEPLVSCFACDDILCRNVDGL